MKKISGLCLIWLFSFMLSLGGIARAEEPVEASAREGIILALLGERMEASFELTLPEWEEGRGIRLSDEDMDFVGATGFDAPLPEEKIELSRIILWDETSSKPVSTNYVTGENVSIKQTIK